MSVYTVKIYHLQCDDCGYACTENDCRARAETHDEAVDKHTAWGHLGSKTYCLVCKPKYFCELCGNHQQGGTKSCSDCSMNLLLCEGCYSRSHTRCAA